MKEADFRAMFPEFWDAAKFPSQAVAGWLAIATMQVNASRWAELTDLGIGLYTAHNLALGAREGGAGLAQTPGTGSTGVMTSKSAGGVSAGYDVAGSRMNGAADLNATTYGVRYARMRREMGAGPIQFSGSLPAGIVLYGNSAAIRSD